MKIDARRVLAFLQDPGRCRVVLLHGDDNGLIRDHSDALLRAAAGSLDDPFRISDLDRDSSARLADEAATPPLGGGRRVVRLREATDAVAAAIATMLAAGSDALVILEAGELQARSKLRSIVEASPHGAAIACYGERGTDLAQTITAVLSASGVKAEDEARTYLCEHLGADRGATRRELEKLALFVHPRSVITLDDAVAIVGDMAGLVLEDALFAASAGQVARAERAVDLAFGEGVSPISIVRQLLMHLQKLARVRAAVDRGLSAAEAVRALRPPVFFRRQDAMARAAALWPQEDLQGACRTVWTVERDCKRTGAPAALLSRHAVLTIARRAAGRRGGA